MVDVVSAPGHRLTLRQGHKGTTSEGIHIIVTAAGYRTLVTYIFHRESESLDSDAAFAVKPPLLRTFEPAPRISHLPGAA